MIKKKPFIKAIMVPYNDLPIELKQPINDLCAELLMVATCSNLEEAKNEDQAELRDFNLSLTAMQKALGLLIQEFFEEDQRDIVIEQACEALRKSRWNTRSD